MQYLKENDSKKEEVLKSLNSVVLHRYKFDEVKSIQQDITPQCCKICGIVHPFLGKN